MYSELEKYLKHDLTQRVDQKSKSDDTNYYFLNSDSQKTFKKLQEKSFEKLNSLTRKITATTN